MAQHLIAGPGYQGVLKVLGAQAAHAPPLDPRVKLRLAFSSSTSSAIWYAALGLTARSSEARCGSPCRADGCFSVMACTTSGVTLTGGSRTRAMQARW